MPCYHVRYTPYTLSHDLKGYCEMLAKQYKETYYCLHQEDKGRGDQASLHYHLYLEHPTGRKSLLDKMIDFLKIPPQGKGHANAYYMFKEVAMKGNYGPKYVLGYVQDDEKLIASNIDPNWALEALEFYRANKPNEEDTSSVKSEAYEHRDQTKTKNTVEDQYLDYHLFMKQKLQQNTVRLNTIIPEFRCKEVVNLRWIKAKTRDYYGGRGIGLFQTDNHMHRFAKSFYYEYLTKNDRHTQETNDEFDNIKPMTG